MLFITLNNRYKIKRSTTMTTSDYLDQKNLTCNPYNLNGKAESWKQIKKGEYRST